ncbi:MAG: hypothetical protein AB7O88_11960 [Reyranellaceae bacterium]
MARDRKIPSDFWTWEAVIDCAPMTRLLFIGLWNFADDFGVQPLRPRTIRMQVFPGDAVDNDAVRAMIDELAAQGLVRIYEVDGVQYVAVIDWDQLQRVGRNAKRRYPALPVPRESEEKKVASVSEADEGIPASTSNAVGDGPPRDPSSSLQPPSPDIRGEKEQRAPPDITQAAATHAPPIAS